MRQPLQPVDSGFERDAFDRVCLRRTALTKQPTVVIQGWAFSTDPKFPLTSVLLASKDDSTTLQNSGWSARPDVQTAYSATGYAIPKQCGFLIMGPWNSRQLPSIKLQHHNGTLAATDTYSVGKAVRIAALQADSDCFIGVDRAEILVADPTGWPKRLSDVLIAVYTSRWMWLFVVCITITTGIIAWYTKSKSARLMVIMSFICVFWACLRIGMYTIIAAGAWDVLARYLKPASILLMMGMCCSVAGAIFFKREESVS